MKKELPLADPPIKNLLTIAYRSSILLTMEAAIPWFYSTYIQLAYDLNGNGVAFLYAYVPFILEKRKGKVKTKTKDICFCIDKIIKIINKDTYIAIGLDEYYMPSRSPYGRTHFKHLSLIYGYDTEKKEFLIQGYSERDVYEPRTLSFEDFKKAYTHYDQTDWFYFKLKKRLKEGENNRRFNKRLFCYYKSIYPLRFRLFSARDLCRNKFFGMETYVHFIELLKYQIESNEYNPNILKSLLAYSEQKCCIATALKYFSDEENDLTDFILFFEKLSKEFLTLRNIQLKFKYTKNSKNIERIIDKLNELIRDENDVLEQYFNLIGSPMKTIKN